MKFQVIFHCCIIVASLCACTNSGDPKTVGSTGASEIVEIEQYAALVNPFIGTDGKGKTYPGATAPFGMVQLSPDNGRNGWDWISGYFYPDTVLAGFSHTHLSGTGIGDLYDISYFPYTGSGKRADIDGDSTTLEIYSTFSHTEETARPGYYGVILHDYDITVELTATTRVGVQMYTFPEKSVPQVRLDLGYRRNWDSTVKTSLEIVSDTLITGYRYSSGWAKDQRVYFASAFSIPFKEHSSETANRDVTLTFDVLEKPLLVKTGISSVSTKNALENMTAEAPGWDFKGMANAVYDQWENELSKVKITSSDNESLEKFYTAMYQSMLAPTVFSDVNGEYKGVDGNVKIATDYTRYSTFSLWDTFRAEHPLLTILHPDRVPDMINSMLAHYDEYGLLPVWDLAANETDMMIGYHSVPVITDAWLKGIRGFDGEKALSAMVHGANQDHFGLSSRKKLGYIPQEDYKESVSLDLEYSFDDWAIYQMAKSLGRDDIAKTFYEKAMSYKKHFDPTTGFMRALDRNGVWTTNFNPEEYSDEYIEGNAWQYSWFAPHDVDGLIELHGGKEPFAKKLDALFDENNSTEGELPVFITGLIGQYVHGNEPAHHVSYLYGLAGEPEKGQALIRKITTELHKASPDGICGNEDCGQMSAWYIFSTLGFYPVNPVGGEYVIGSPTFGQVEITLAGGKSLTIIATGAEETPFVERVLWNGEPLEEGKIHHNEIMEGGTLEFVMKARDSGQSN